MPRRRAATSIAISRVRAMIRNKTAMQPALGDA
jgi:hypothetical protein